MQLLWLGDFFYDYDYISDDIEKISQWIKKNNYKTILNLEGVIDCENYPRLKKRGPNLSSTIVAIDVLKKLNVVGVTLANNHIMDYGETGLLHTIELLDNNNILHTGAGSNIEESIIPFVLSDGNKKIAICSFGWDVEETIYATSNSSGCAPKDEKIVLTKTKELKSSFDKVFVVFHWGFEYNRYPMPIDIELAHKVIDEGASLIIGHHPHCVQPKEMYKDAPIYYSLGNFYFSSRREKFNKNFKNENVVNQSDYGIAVGYNFDGKVCDYLIKYDRLKKGTFINPKLFDGILVDITGVDYNSKEYYRLVKNNKVNFNPVLAKNKIKNIILLIGLFINYKIRKIAKIILKGGKCK